MGIRGTEKEQEIDPSKIVRDIRTTPEFIADFLSSATGASMMISTMIGLTIAFPAFSELALAASAGVTYYAGTRRHTLPFRMPAHSPNLDWNDINPGNKKPQKANGIFFLGNRIKDGQELWFKKDDICTHFLVFGSTGSGKTEALLGMAYNAIVQGGGFLYVDGKGDSALFSKVYALVRYAAREDDLLVINYMTGNKDMFDVPDTKMSNTTNPLANGSSSTLTQMLVSLMDDGGDGKGGDMWKGRAISLMSAVVPALVWLRDKRGLLLDVGQIREFLNLSKIVELRKIEEMPIGIKDALRSYCESLAGWVERKGANQGDATLEQHGYLQMQFTRVMGSLSDDYGHIFKTQLGEVDFYDVVVNRRILLVLLPALEKAPAELANLGKIIVAMMKSMMATSLGAKLEGEYKDVIESKPTNSDSPFTAILDEYGYYAVSGSAVMPAQARSLNFQMVFAGQDYPAFKKASPEEAASIIANCNIKIFMKLEDPTDTFELFDKAVGETYVSHTGGFQSNSQGITNTYMDINNVSIEKRSRGNLQDLQGQKPGEMHVLFAGNIVRAAVFYVNPPKPRMMRLNHFLRVRPPSMDAIMRMDEEMDRLKSILTGDEAPPAAVNSMDIRALCRSLASRPDLNAISSGIAAVVDYSKGNHESAAAVANPGEDGDEDDDDFFGSSIDEIMSPSSGPFLDAISDSSDVRRMLEQVAQESAMSSRMPTSNDINNIKRGMSEIERTASGEQLTDDNPFMAGVENISGYPKTDIGQIEPDDYMDSISDAISNLDMYINAEKAAKAKPDPVIGQQADDEEDDEDGVDE